MVSLTEKLAADFNIHFQDETLLLMAFTHSSYANEQRTTHHKEADNERLEFLGDAALELVISRYLYSHYPKKPEGELSRMRSSIVRDKSLAAFSRQCGFDQYVRLGRGEEHNGGRKRTKILEDLFEAFLGALLLDQGIEAVEHFLEQVMFPEIEQGRFDSLRDYKTLLQERLQVNGDIKITYETINEIGPAHDKSFEVLLSVDGQAISKGQGRSKKIAEQHAAEQAMLELDRGEHVSQRN